MTHESDECRHIGQFKIPVDLINGEPDQVAEMFARIKMLIVRAEMHFRSRSIEYVGICPSFSYVSIGEEPPWYHLRATVQTKHGEKPKVVCVEIERQDIQEIRKLKMGSGRLVAKI